MKRKLSGVLIASAMLTGTAYAEQFDLLGIRALGMGGANVAAVRDSNASYWNPAAYGFFAAEEADKGNDGGLGRYAEKDWGLGIDAGVGYTLTGNLAERVNDLAKVNFAGLQTAATAGGVLTQQQIADSMLLVNWLSTLNSQAGFVVRPNGSVDVRVQHYGVGIHVLGGVAITGTADLTNIAPANLPNMGAIATQITGPVAPGAPVPPANNAFFSAAQNTQLVTVMTGNGVPLNQAQTAVNSINTALAANPNAAGLAAPLLNAVNTVLNATGTIQNNKSRVHFRGVAVSEVPITYGQTFSPNLSLGGSVKLMRGKVYASDISIFNQTNTDLRKKSTQNSSTSTSFGIDLGAMYRLPASNVQAGLLVRNLNSPKFKGQIVDTYSGANIGSYTYQMKPQVRAGVAWMPTENTAVAADLDLLRNDTLIKGRSSQMINLGAEWDLFRFLALRAGMYKDIANSDVGLVYTGGLGVNLWAARLDVGGAISTKKTMIGGKNRPAQAQAAAALNIDF